MNADDIWIYLNSSTIYGKILRMNYLQPGQCFCLILRQISHHPITQLSLFLLIYILRQYFFIP